MKFKDWSLQGTCSPASKSALATSTGSVRRLPSPDGGETTFPHGDGIGDIQSLAPIKLTSGRNIMNKFLLPILAFILLACAAPQVTVTSEVTVTSPPPTATLIPTPTLHPQFITLQTQVAASGERFTLTSDGTIQDGATTIPGLRVANDGKITITINNEQVTVNPEDVSFDDDKGINVAGYTLDQETGKWGVAQEIILTQSGIGFELGAQIEGQPDGVLAVVDIVPNSVWNAEKQADFEERVDPTTYGFAEGETRFVYIPTEDGKYRVELQRTSNPVDVIAIFGSNDFVWKISEMVDENGDPVFLNAGKIVEMRGGVPVNPSTTRSAGSRLVDGFYEAIQRNFPRHQLYIFVSKDGKRGVQFNFAATGDGTDGKGYVYFRDEDKRTVRYIYVEDFVNTPSFVQRLH